MENVNVGKANGERLQSGEGGVDVPSVANGADDQQKGGRPEELVEDGRPGCLDLLGRVDAEDAHCRAVHGREGVYGLPVGGQGEEGPREGAQVLCQDVDGHLAPGKLPHRGKANGDGRVQVTAGDASADVEGGG